MSNTIRIRTTPGGGDQYISVDINRDFDYLEVLSLRVSSEEFYRKYCADYGAVVGRVIVNNGYGVPNVKVSLFLPLSDDDSSDSVISNIYPFNSVYDKDIDGIEYNLLPNTQQGPCHVPIGTLPNINEVLDDNIILEVFDKYYKYTTTTNEAGDFMFFGVPVGQYTLHADLDISDIGQISQSPYELIADGKSEKLFKNPSQYKNREESSNTPIQIKSFNKPIRVVPLWGDKDNCEVGITRVDPTFTDFKVSTYSLFFGNIFTDSDKNSINKNCRPRKDLGLMSQMQTVGGKVEVLKVDNDDIITNGEDKRYGKVSYYSGDDNTGSKSDDLLIDDDGNWAFPIRLNLNNVITDEYGELVPSGDPDVGIPTEAKVRFKISPYASEQAGRVRRRASFLVPNMTNNYFFDKRTQIWDFETIRWKKIYTVRQYIPRIQKNNLDKTLNHTGIKDVDGSENGGSFTPFPFNRIRKDGGGFLFFFLCPLMSIILGLIAFLNSVIVPIINFILKIVDLIISFFGGSKGYIGCIQCEENRNNQDDINLKPNIKYGNSISKKNLENGLTSILISRKWEFEQNGGTYEIDEITKFRFISAGFNDGDERNTNFLKDYFNDKNDKQLVKIPKDIYSTNSNIKKMTLIIKQPPNNSNCTIPGGYDGFGPSGWENYVWVRVNLIEKDSGNEEESWINLGQVSYLPFGYAFEDCEYPGSYIKGVPCSSKSCIVGDTEPKLYAPGCKYDSVGGQILYQRGDVDSGVNKCITDSGSPDPLGIVTGGTYSCKIYCKNDPKLNGLPETNIITLAKNCYAAEQAENSNIMKFDFYNDWITGSLYAPLFKYKKKIKKRRKKYGQIKKERFCDYDPPINNQDPIHGKPDYIGKPKVNVGGHGHHQNTKNNLNFVEPDIKSSLLSNTYHDTTYFSNKKSTDLEKRGIIKWENSNIDNKDEGDLYYAAFYSELKTNNSNLLPGFALDGSDSTKGQNGEMSINNIMYATQLVELGSTILCDKDNVPIFIDEIPDTTYNKPETEINVFYSVTCDGINNVKTDRVAMACEISKDVRDMFENGASLSENFVDDLNLVVNNTNGPQAAFDVDGPDILDPDEFKIREYLCQNFYTWTNSPDYKTGSSVLTKLKSYKFCETTDTSDSSYDKNYCWNNGNVVVNNNNCGNNWIQHGFKQNPFYFYFGPKKSAINKLKDKYLGQCLVSDRGSIYKEQIKNLKNTNR
jgi:hypothetical protein